MLFKLFKLYIKLKSKTEYFDGYYNALCYIERLIRFRFPNNTMLSDTYIGTILEDINEKKKDMPRILIKNIKKDEGDIIDEN